MPEIIKDGAVVSDDWCLIEDAETGIPAEGKIILPLALWQTQREALLARGECAVLLSSEHSATELAGDLAALPLVALQFPKFTDGRPFSIARELRERWSYTGEIRAVGDFMRDQLFYMQRCGFNSFALPGDDLAEALASLSDFTESYQAAIDQAKPLFRRHSLA